MGESQNSRQCGRGPGERPGGCNKELRWACPPPPPPPLSCTRHGRSKLLPPRAKGPMTDADRDEEAVARVVERMLYKLEVRVCGGVL